MPTLIKLFLRLIVSKNQYKLTVMTKSFLIALLLILGFTSIRAQEKEKDSPDSSDDKTRQTSYLRIGAGIGNQLLSLHNKALNAGQSTNTIIFTPSIGYYHKSGFAIAFEGYLLSDSGSTNFYQTSLTPSYEYDGKEITAAVSYSRYFVKNQYGGSASPIQNDLYSSVVFKKGWLWPSVAVGYSSGKYKEINLVTVNIPSIGPRTFYDTATTKTTAFSLIGSIEHTFEFYEVLSKNADLSFTPSLMANAGSAKYIVTHANKFSVANTGTTRRKGKLRPGSGESGNSPFALQSVGANFDFLYTIGKFSFEPQLYLDYYLLQTDSKKFTQVYNINFALSF